MGLMSLFLNDRFDLTSTGFTFAATTGKYAPLKPCSQFESGCLFYQNTFHATLHSPPKGIPEKHYAIEVPFYDEIDAEVCPSLYVLS